MPETFVATALVLCWKRRACKSTHFFPDNFTHEFAQMRNTLNNRL